MIGAAAANGIGLPGAPGLPLQAGAAGDVRLQA
jgi:hypothetical protein